MIKAIKLEKELFVGVINQPGVLAKLTSFLVNHGINIEAILGYTTNVGQEAGLMFITDNNKAAIDAFLEKGFTAVQENEVLVIELENVPGALKNITVLLAQHGININYIYAAGCTSGCPVRIVLSTTDNRGAMHILTQ